MGNKKAESPNTEAKNGEKRGRGWGLSSLPACRRRLARLLSDIDDDTVQDLPKARTLIYGISQVIACLKFEAELEIVQRIDALETELSKGASE